MEAVLELRKKNGPLEVAGGETGSAYLGVPCVVLEAVYDSGVQMHLQVESL